MNLEKTEDSLLGETARNKKIRYASEIFNCQCGKNYLTFSALYLHVRLKHNQRLTTKKDQNNFKIQEINNKKYTTYFLKQSLNITQNQYNIPKKPHINQNNLHSQSQSPSCIDIINQYLSLVERRPDMQQNFKQNVVKILTGLIQYFNELQELNTETNYKDIPLFYNQFVVYYLLHTRKNNLMFLSFQIKAKVLQTFHQWMKQMNYTKLQLKIVSHQLNNPNQWQKL